MRIVSGTLRGRPLKAPEGRQTRPTTDRVREALFSSLFSQLGTFDGVRVLDAFAGSGALGLEALSRGADAAVFYETDRSALRALEGNIAACGLTGPRCGLHRCDVMKAPFPSGAGAFGLVFLDPPYATSAAAVMGLLQRLADAGALAPGAVAVYEHDARDAQAVQTAAAEAGFAVTASKAYGKTSVSFLKEER